MDMNQIHLHNGTYYTSDTMFEAGQGACCECGTPRALIDSMKQCQRCFKAFIVIRSKFIPVTIMTAESPRGKYNIARTMKIRLVADFVNTIREELNKQGVSSISVCPYETYFKVYLQKGHGSSGILDSFILKSH